MFPVSKPHPDDGTPIPRRSTYFGREKYHQVREPSGELVRRAAEATFNPIARLRKAQVMGIVHLRPTAHRRACLRSPSPSVTADYEAETAVERELVLRLASVLWRLRRATAIETVLFAMPIQEILNGRPADVGDSEPGPRIMSAQTWWPLRQLQAPQTARTNHLASLWTGSFRPQATSPAPSCV